MTTIDFLKKYPQLIDINEPNLISLTELGNMIQLYEEFEKRNIYKGKESELIRDFNSILTKSRRKDKIKQILED
jgi:hypothetical protein